VVRRTREIGIRLALGAGPVAVVRSTLADIAVVTILGIAGGLAGGLFFVRFIRALLFETEALSLVSLMLPVAVLTLVAFAATFRPAARAARVNPTEALRSE
jgi:ABC-type antimicrobial peptide transport system permease subunit